MSAVTMTLFCAGCMVAQPAAGEVKLALASDPDLPAGRQPAGWPVVVEVTLTNLGKAPIEWRCGGPDRYPGAEGFRVQVRYGDEAQWHDVEATNGQYFAASGGTERLDPGASVKVPLAVPVRAAGVVTVRVQPRPPWQTAAPAELQVPVVDGDSWLADVRRTTVIGAAIRPDAPPFRRHLAQRYADKVVVEALLRLITLDNKTIVAMAADVLSLQPVLPESAGDDLAAAVRRWLPQDPQIHGGALYGNVLEAALKTRSEPARRAVLEVLKDPPTSRVRWAAIGILGGSEGDDAWLRRARAAILAAQQATRLNAEETEHVQRAIKSLEERIKDRRP